MSNKDKRQHGGHTPENPDAAITTAPEQIEAAATGNNGNGAADDTERGDLSNGIRGERNRFDALFESVSFKGIVPGQVYTRRDGTKSVMVARATLNYVGGFSGIPGSVYLRKPAAGDPYVEFAFSGGGRGQADPVLTFDTQAGAELKSLLNRLHEEAGAWWDANSDKIAKGTTGTTTRRTVKGVAAGMFD